MSKLKLILASIGSGIIAVFCFIFHIQRNKINNLKAENKAKEGTITNYKNSVNITDNANSQVVKNKEKNNEEIKNDWYKETNK